MVALPKQWWSPVAVQSRNSLRETSAQRLSKILSQFTFTYRASPTTPNATDAVHKPSAVRARHQL